MMKAIPVLPIVGKPHLEQVPGALGVRYTTYTADLLDLDGNVLGPVPGYVDGGEVSWTANSSVKGAGSLPLEVANDTVDWTGKRIRLAMTYRDDNGDPHNCPLGVWIPQVPQRSHVGTHLTKYSITLKDKLAKLDTDTIHDAGGNNAMYSIKKGQNIVAAVKSVIEDGGEDASYISSGDETASTDTTWSPTDKRLQIVNDLLDSGNYFSLITDRFGHFRNIKYHAPQQRRVIYADGTPFGDTQASRMLPEWSDNQDVSGVPNRWVSVGQQDDEDTPALVAVAEDLTGTPYSHDRVGYWIGDGDDGVAAASMAELQQHANRKLTSAQTASRTIDVSHLFLEEMDMNAMVMFDVGSRGWLTTCTKMTVKLDPVGTCTSTLRVVNSA